MTLLNEVIHLRQQIGLVCESTHKATNGAFFIDPRAPHLKRDGSTTDDPVYIEDYVALKG